MPKSVCNNVLELFIRIFLSRIFLQIRGPVVPVPVGIEMTREEMLFFIAMSGMSRKLVERLSWMSRRDWHKMMVSKGHISKMNLQPIICRDNYVHSLTFDSKTSILSAGWDDTGNIRIIFPDGTFITTKMNHSVSNVTVL
jgi:hypothetical protein